MQQNFTREILVKYLYNETTELENQYIEDAVKNDHSLQQELEQLSQIKNSLDQDGGSSPSSECIGNIIDYAKLSLQEEV